jgi:ribose transport system substrate-binding protein
MVTKGRAGHALMLLIAAAAVAIGIAGCGGGSDSSSSSTSSTAGGEGNQSAAQDQKRLTALYKGTYEEPTGPAVKPTSGENVWVISVGQGTEATADQTGAIKQVGGELGWNVTVVDGQFDPNKMLSGVQQALAAKADAIVLIYIDCPLVKTGLEAAKEAGVPVVATESSDCNELQAGDPQLINWVVHYGKLPFREWIQDWGAAQADYVIAQNDGEANAIVVAQTDTETTRLGAKGAEDELDKCSKCSYQEVPLVGTELGPPLQEKISQALITDPDANAFIPGYDGLLTSGGAQALRASGRLDEISVMEGEGSIPGIKLIYEGVADACVGIPTAWEGYAAIDATIRLLAGKDPAESDSGIGIQICDKEHNLPPEGKGYEPPFDYVAAYRQLWGLQG